MSNPTSNFGWQMPTATDLVTDLPADFEVFGQAVDTALMDLKGGTTGQILAKNSNTDMDFVWSAPSAFGTWTSFTPTWTNITVGNGTQVAKYVQNGKVVNFRIKLQFGSTTSITGSPSVNWPVAPASTEAAQGAVTQLILEKSGAGPRQGMMNNSAASTTKADFYALNVAGTYTDLAIISSTVPFTWAANDQIYFMGTYEVA